MGMVIQDTSQNCLFYAGFLYQCWILGCILFTACNRSKRDGIIGEETKSKTIQFVDNDLLLRMYKRREQFYYDIAVGEQKKFLAGWLNRNRSVLNQIINSHKLS